MGDGGAGQGKLPGGMTSELSPNAGIGVGHATESVWAAGMQLGCSSMLKTLEKA